MKKTLFVTTCITTSTLAGSAIMLAVARVPLYDLSIHLVPTISVVPSFFRSIPLILWIVSTVMVFVTAGLLLSAYRRRAVSVRGCLGCVALLIIVPVVSYGVAHAVAAHERMLRVQGFVIDPITKQSYDGINATVGDTALRLNTGSALAFDMVGSRHGISVTHKDFHRRVVMLPQAFDAKTGSIYFSPSMLNALVAVIDAEARGKYDRIYEQLPTELKGEISMQEYFNGYKPLVSLDDMADQEVVIAGVESRSEIAPEGFSNRLRDAYLVTVYKDYHQAVYILSHDTEGVWRVTR